MCHGVGGHVNSYCTATHRCNKGNQEIAMASVGASPCHAWESTPLGQLGGPLWRSGCRIQISCVQAKRPTLCTIPRAPFCFLIQGLGMRLRGKVHALHAGNPGLIPSNIYAHTCTHTSQSLGFGSSSSWSLDCPFSVRPEGASVITLSRPQFPPLGSSSRDF